MYSSFRTARGNSTFKSYNGPRAEPLHQNDSSPERSPTTFSKPGSVLASPATIQPVNSPQLPLMEVGSAVREALSEAGSQANPIVVEDSWAEIEDLTTDAPQSKRETSCEVVYIGPRRLPTNGQASVEETSSKCQIHDTEDERALPTRAVKANPQRSQDERDMDAHTDIQAIGSGCEDADTEYNNFQRQQDGGAEKVQQSTPKRSRIIEDSQDREYSRSNHGSDIDKSSAGDAGSDGDSDDGNNDEGSGNCSITSPPKKRSHLDPPNHPYDSSAYRSEYAMQTLRQPVRPPCDESESDSANSLSPAAASSAMKQASVPLLVSTADWDVESISSKRKRNGRIEYRVDWASTWHDAEALGNCKELIRGFEQSERYTSMLKKRRLYL
ncbi:MAG: hypothetical protein M1828_002979 [Chrysothrix sp. TS-e1954]|nr:MAG: hypothetical protein M1828_002979 [Chrysothrix sp. TS-e1954]